MSSSKFHRTTKSVSKIYVHSFVDLFYFWRLTLLGSVMLIFSRSDTYRKGQWYISNGWNCF